MTYPLPLRKAGSDRVAGGGGDESPAGERGGHGDARSGRQRRGRGDGGIVRAHGRGADDGKHLRERLRRRARCGGESDDARQLRDLPRRGDGNDVPPAAEHHRMVDRGRREPPRAQGRRRCRRTRGLGGGAPAVGQPAAGDGDRSRDPLRRRWLSRLALSRQCDYRECGRPRSLSRQCRRVPAQRRPAAPRRSHRPARLRGDATRRRRQWAGCALSRPHRRSGRRGHGGARRTHYDGRPRDIPRHSSASRCARPTGARRSRGWGR